ncbi:MAG TPA: hypothetical protein VH438_10025 [Gemmatimonadales bacterium]
MMLGFRTKASQAGFLLLLALACASALAAQGRPEGEWRLDMAKAGLDSGTAKADSQVPIRPSWGGTPPVTAGGEPRQPTPGGYGGQRPEWSEKARSRMRETMVLSRRVPRRIRIDAQASTFTVVDDSGGVKTFQIDGKKLEEPLDGGGTVETTVKWDHDAIVIERKVGGGGKVKTRYELGLGGTRLIAFVDLDGMVQGRSFTLHYLKVPPDSTGNTGASSAP